jgi:RNA polymerase sigma-70 factor (ECF subfamily)
VLTFDVLKFEAVWPSVARRLEAMLRRRGVDPCTAEDAVQETAARALVTEVPFDGADSLLRWSNTVAWRVVLEGRRRQRLVVAEIPDRPADVDIVAEVEARDRVRALLAAFPQLSPQDQLALTRMSSVGVSRTEAVREAVRRHRARARLAALMESVVGVLVAIWRCVRRLRTSRLGVTAVVVPALLVALSFDIRSHRGGPSDGPTSFAPERGAPDLRHPVVGTAPRPRSRSDSIGHTPTPASIARRVDPPVGIAVPTPVGPAELWGRPKEADDPLGCIDAIVIGSRCIDLPVHITG